MKIYSELGILLFFLMLLPGITSATPGVHPYLLFHDISEVPGYQYRTTDPWKTWEATIISSANEALTKDFSKGYSTPYYLGQCGGWARDSGLAYQITKDLKYSSAAKRALLNYTQTTTSAGEIDEDKANALGRYVLAYDWIQPTLSAAEDKQIRDILAKRTDEVYYDLNHTYSYPTQYVSFWDYHGQMYPMVGVAGAALADYTNPNHINLSTTPEDWHKVGTDYLFVDDKLHPYGRSLFSFGFDETSGKSVNGAYKNYVIEQFALWLQVYNRVYQENPFDKYPATKKAFTSEIWESLPNDYSGNFGSLGNTGWVYQEGFVSLLPDNEKGPVLNHIDRIKSASALLPYSTVWGNGRTSGGISNDVLYCTYGNYASVSRTFPTNTSYLDSNSIYQVIRGNWNNDSDWLSLVTFNKVTKSARDSGHMDQLSFEYYSKGNILLADAGEPKSILWNEQIAETKAVPYGQYDTNHNTISIENPRTPFPVSPWSGSTSAGIFKGDSNGIVTPVNVGSIIQVPWLQLIKTQASITTVMAEEWEKETRLSSPIQYERTILYPDSDYFIIVDRMEGTEPWIYRNIFRPSSLMVTPTVDANKDGAYTEAEIGHVNGALTIGSTPYNWQALPRKTETNTGITTNSLSWATTSPYGKDVRLNLVSSPASEILVEKNIGRIGGYTASSEVYNPVVWFRTPASSSEYRVTALLSSYSTELAKTAMEIPVTGNGHAIKVSSASADDYIYTGKGISSFAGFITDADTVYIHQRGGNAQVTLLGGSFLNYQNDFWVALIKRADLITVNRVSGLTDYRIQGESDLQGDIFQQPVDIYKIEKRTNDNAQQTNEQQKSMQNSNSDAMSEETSNIIAFLANLTKSVLSIFT